MLINWKVLRRLVTWELEFVTGTKWLNMSVDDKSHLKQIDVTFTKVLICVRISTNFSNSSKFRLKPISGNLFFHFDVQKIV